MKKRGIIFTVLYVLCMLVYAQSPDVLTAENKNTISINASLVPDKKQLSIEQIITYKNTSADTLKTIYLNDWMESYSVKTSPLAKRFAEEFKSDFHFA
ncbi:MAG: hypothetical protein KDD08_09650, partial [Mangrovimonas sp.]|nr:hypothetical protein [Mangrovimonas sp.]